MAPRALVTGVTGQDGSYLAEHLIRCGYEVYGLIRGQSNTRQRWITELIPELRVIRGDLLDLPSLIRAVDKVKPDEVYNLAGISYVPLSWEQAELTAGTTGLGVLRILEAIRIVSGIQSATTKGQIKLYQASTSEMFGKASELPLSEKSHFHPRSPYAASKVLAHLVVQNYRESYGMFAVSGILFNHESPRRPPVFVTRKISQAVARVVNGLPADLGLGNLDARRDWGFAPDYVEAMHLMLQQETPQDLVIATGTTHSVRDFARQAFFSAGLDWEHHVTQDPTMLRPADVEVLRADPSRALAALGWSARTTFDELVRIMVESDIKDHRQCWQP